MISTKKSKNLMRWIRHGVCALFFTSLAIPALAQDQDVDSPLPHNPECTLQSFLGRARGIDEGVFDQLTPDQVLVIGVNYGNPNNAQLDRSSQLHGAAIDLGCILARRLGVEVKFVGYPGIPPMTQGFANGEFRLGFSFDPQFGPQIFAYAHPHLGIENTYLVPAGSTILTVADADRPGVRISVARGNSPDIYLTAHLTSATLVRFDTVPQALAALKAGQVDAFAGSRSAEAAFLPQLPGGRILPDNFLIANAAAVLAIGADDALRFVNRFVEESKMNFLIQLAISRAGLIGVSVPDPIRRSPDQDDQRE
jgi:polar amino acid transport system substrate-binding protein